MFFILTSRLAPGPLRWIGQTDEIGQTQKTREGATLEILIVPQIAAASSMGSEHSQELERRKQLSFVVEEILEAARRGGNQLRRHCRLFGETEEIRREVQKGTQITVIVKNYSINYKE